jgi:ATP-dependent DNA helicase DinG
MRLIEWFKETPHSVLFATSSFWEGVDVPGESLSCVIIDRLPFAVPDDPVVQAYVERLKMQGRDWFREYTLPEAILRLKQGFGRLIRTSSDRGVVAILDARLHTKYYGRQILRALPACGRLESASGVASWMDE